MTIEEAVSLLRRNGYVVKDPEFFDTRLFVSRDDVETAGYEGGTLDDNTMRQIAKQFSKNDGLMESWWETIKVACGDLGIHPLKTEGE